MWRLDERREFNPAWDSTAKINTLLDVIDASARHGLSENGSLHFLPDIYGRDAAVVAALHEPYQPPVPRVSAAARRR